MALRPPLELSFLLVEVDEGLPIWTNNGKLRRSERVAIPTFLDFALPIRANNGAPSRTASFASNTLCSITASEKRMV